jgi:hypothetical protein
MTCEHPQEIVCQQVLVEGSSVFSTQSTVFPPELASDITPRFLLERYLSYIRGMTLTIIRPVTSGNGIEFRLLASRWSLICFQPPTEVGSSLILRICGGFLVQKHHCDRGELRFMAEHETFGTRVTLQLSDYCPLILGSSSPSKIRYWIYRLTQALIHRLVTVRFLVLLYRNYAGYCACVTVVDEKAREGRPL